MLTIKKVTKNIEEITLTDKEKEYIKAAAEILHKLCCEYPLTGEYDQQRIALGTAVCVLVGLAQEKPFVDISTVGDQDDEWWDMYDVENMKFW